ncbi:MAG: CotH kinase family protein [Candidatus Marinimicrobia bacterium]|nr:CotH kinase family protein [Candidatus Neomarinimicrobiota bacterium]
MEKVKFVCTFIIVVYSFLFANEVDFKSSNLPIVIIDTGGEDILDEPKIMANMKIIWNADGSRNYITDTCYNYNGWIGIEMRGASSQDRYPKKQYAVETRNKDKSNNNVNLLDLPKENDWILHAPYSDKTFMRNFLAYELSRDMGWYASRCRYCELVKNGEYMGIYILMEKIKEDDDRVDISTLKEDEISGDDLTGGYIIKIDKFEGAQIGGWYSSFPADNGANIYYQYHDPDGEDLVQEQKEYIQDKIYNFEAVMKSREYANPQAGYSYFINVASFVDYFLLNELTHNIDSYRLSTYLYKDKDSDDKKIYAGPVWDYNLGFGNADYYLGWTSEDWILDIYKNDGGFKRDHYQPPFWWSKLWNEPNLRAQAEDRWQQLRQNIFSKPVIFARIDSIANLLDEAKDRNFQRWSNVLGHDIWPNPSGYAERTTYESEVNYLKNWINDRIDWMDDNINDYPTKIDNNSRINRPEKFILYENYPNPFNAHTIISYKIPAAAYVKIDVLNIKGQLVDKLFEGQQNAGLHSIQFDGKGLNSGIYFYKVNINNESFTRKCLLIK